MSGSVQWSVADQQLEPDGAQSEEVCWRIWAAQRRLQMEEDVWMREDF